MQLPYTLGESPSKPQYDPVPEAFLRACLPENYATSTCISEPTDRISVEGNARDEDPRLPRRRAAVQYRDVGVGTTEQHDPIPLAQPLSPANNNTTWSLYLWPLSLIISWFFNGSATAALPNPQSDKQASGPVMPETSTHRPRTIDRNKIIKLPGSDRPAYPHPYGIDPFKYDFADCVRDLERKKLSMKVKEECMPVIKLEGYDDPVYKPNPLFEALESGELTARELNGIFGRG